MFASIKGERQRVQVSVYVVWLREKGNERGESFKLKFHLRLLQQGIKIWVINFRGNLSFIRTEFVRE